MLREIPYETLEADGSEEPEVFVAPASFAQRRLWLLDTLSPGRATYNVPLALRLRGPLDARVLAAALDGLVDRHETLRTALAEEEGEPVQRIYPALSVPLPAIDLAALPAVRQEEEARVQIERDAATPFDLSRAPLLRALLLRLEREEHVLLLDLHHAVTDAWSLEVLVRELLALYEACRRGLASPLAELPIQYADFAVWQRDWLRGEALERKLAPWRLRLAGAPPDLPLPADRPRRSGDPAGGGVVAADLSPELSDALRAAGRESGATPFMTLLAGFQALLSRLSGRTDLVVGTPVSGRGRVETEGLIGFFVNTLALRADLSGDPTFRDLLVRARGVVVEAFAHDDLPFEKLVEELCPERRLDRNPLFQVVFALQQSTAAAPGPRDSDLQLIEAVETHSGTAKFDLTLSLMDAPEGIRGFWEYSTALFDRTTAARLSGQWRTLLTDAVAHPDRPLSALALLDPAARHQLALEWNDARTAYPREETIPALFAAQVERTPDAPALLSAAGTVTYAELAERARALAGRLRWAGLGPGDLAGVLLERGPEMVVAWLAVLEAGGAYLPLDPGYPAERLAFLMADSGARVLITRRELLDGLPVQASVVLLDDEMEVQGSPGTAIPAIPDSLAYVVYTSGSTGTPKGVAVPHRAVIRLVRETDYVQLQPGDRVAQASNASFDAATFEVWGALLNGACLVEITREAALEPRLLADQLRERGVTALFLTTALFNQMAREEPGGFSTLRHLLFGGEAVDPAAVARVLRGGAPERLLHVYGPTESTTFSTWHLVTEIADGSRTVPIGRPLANTRIDLLDAGLAPVPIGAVGELYIGGDGLARGYLHRPELTAERFVPDPAGGGERLYRTGDLARRRPDGAIEFVGRTDHQVKLRGFRVEPGEIQAVLESHPGVREAFVVPWEEGDDRRLAAYVVPADTSASAAAELRAFLRQRLPDYMMPAAFITLAALPLTPNLKVDRDALPAPGGDLDTAGEETAAPRTPTEELLLGLWEELLGVRGIGVRDDFFALGGHSLLAVQLISRVREACAVEVPLRALFETPTVEGLAEEVEALLRAGTGVEMPPLLPMERDRDVAIPLSFAQQRLWMLDQMEVALTAYNVPLALRLEGDLDREALRRGLEEIVHRHEALRTTFEWMDGNPVQVVLPPEPLDLPTTDLQGMDGEARAAEVDRKVRKEATAPFDLQTDRLFRASLLALGPREHVLLVTLHHVVSDGWSIGVLLSELAALYTAFRDGQESPLAPLPVQYPDYSVWQRRWMAGETLERQLAWWRSALADTSPLELPTDRPYRSVHTFAGGHRSAQLPRETSEGVAALCRQGKVTLFMALLAAWSALLARSTGQRRIAVGSPVANRNRTEIEGLIGFFVNTLVLRDRPRGRPLGARGLAAGAGGHARRLRPPGHAFPEAGRGACAPAQPPALPLSRSSSCSRTPAAGHRAAGPAAHQPGGRHRHHQVRADPRLYGNRRRSRGRAGVQQRPLRPRHGRAPAGPLRQPAGRPGGRPGAAALRAPRARRRRAPAAPGRVERHPPRRPRRDLDSPPVRGRGGGSSRGCGPSLRR